ncbi:DVU_1553 family AMP-dependent CoA ligase [Citrifermentans pelophilum]|nr:AMP-binding protein [Geoanaerobacter pelophilus]
MLTPLEPWIKGKIGLRQHEPLTNERLKRYQLQRLQETIAYARCQSPFYRRHLAGCDAPASLDEIGRLPFTTPTDIQANGLSFLSVSQDEIERVVTLQSSGTTASPKRLQFTAADLELTVDFFHNGMATMVQPGDRVLILMPGELPGSVGELLVRGLARLGVEGIVHGLVRDPAAVLTCIIEQRIDCLVGIPVQLLSLARHPLAASLPAGQLRSILLSADYVPQAIVRELEQLWGAAVFNHYGMTETGLGGGVECRHRCGYHLREADLYFEVIDPASGAPLPVGKLGELVVTTLTREGMPLIRYRTGDLARFLGEPCPCGTVLRRLERVTGRLANRVRLTGGSLLTMAELDETLFPLPFLLNFRPELRAVHGVDLLELTVECLDTDEKEASRLIQRALTTIPALAAAFNERQLILGPIREEALTVNGAIKRTIIDRRKEHTC